MITEEAFIEIWRALFVATPVFVTGILILMAYWNWGIPGPIIVSARKAKKKSFWVWAIMRIIETVKGVLTWIFSTEPFKLLAKIPGAIWRFGDAVFNRILNNMMKIGVGLGVISVGMEFAHRQIEINQNIYFQTYNQFTVDPYARYVALLGIIFSFYGYWREEVKESD